METKIVLKKTEGGKRIRGVLEVKLNQKKVCAPYTDVNHVVHAEGKQIMELSVCGSIDGCFGQCVDQVAKAFPEIEDVQRLAALWQRYHLNGMKSGCVHQKTGSYDDKSISGQVCQGYKYGSAWLFEEIPAETLKEIKDICDRLTSQPVDKRTAIEEFADKNEIKMEAKFIDLVDRDGGGKANEWRIKFTKQYTKKSFSVPFFMGIGLVKKNGIPKHPTINDVLLSLSGDCRLAEDSFEDFCSNTGYDEDSISDRKLYDACVTEAKRVKEFLGKSYDEFLSLEEES